MRRLLPLCCLLFAGLLQAQPSQPLTLDRIMADPSWIGPPVEQAWWSWDGREVYYPLRRGDTRIQDLYAQPVDGGQRSEEHTSELQSRPHLVCRLLLEKKKSSIEFITRNCA